MVHQHFMLVPVFTVAENVMLGVERTSVLGLLNRRRARKDVLELSSRYGLAVDPDVLVENLPVGIQQRVEIVKALHREASVVILDEPTAVLTPGETNELFRIMRELQASGKSIIFISHKLKEVQEIADRITVIRRGRVVGSPPPTATDEELASLMVGRAVELTVHKEPAHPGEVTLEVESLRVENAAGRAVVDDISLEVRSGEIVGIAGVQGNGQTELCEAIMGLLPVKSGSIIVAGQDLTGARTRVVLESGVSYIPEDRQEDGIVESFSLADNLVLDVYNRAPFGPRASHRHYPRKCRQAHGRVRHPGNLDRHDGGDSLGRQPAEGHRCSRARSRGAPARCQPAHARPRRGLYRVRAQPARRGPGPGHSRPDLFDRAR
jgi:simple sugar transport system ATP-binding protein